MADWSCETCVHYPPSSFGGKPCAMCNPDDPMMDCYAKWEETPPTNADRIRSMTDKELAKELCALLWCEICPVAGRCKDGVDAWLEWLRSPVGGDGDG